MWRPGSPSRTACDSLLWAKAGRAHAELTVISESDLDNLRRFARRVVPRESLRAPQALFPKLPPHLRITYDAPNSFCNFLRISGVHQDGRVTYHLWKRTHIRCQHRDAAGKRLQRRQSESFVKRGKKESHRAPVSLRECLG